MGAGTKRKEDPSSSNPRKKQKTYVSQGYQDKGQGYQDKGQGYQDQGLNGTFSQVGLKTCYFC